MKASRAWCRLAVAAVVPCSLATLAQTPPGPPLPIPAALVTKVNAAVDADTARLTANFKDLHQHPEIAFTESRTAAIVAKDLRSLGFAVTEGVGKTGVVGVLRSELRSTRLLS